MQSEQDGLRSTKLSILNAVYIRADFSCTVPQHGKKVWLTALRSSQNKIGTVHQIHLDTLKVKNVKKCQFHDEHTLDTLRFACLSS